MKNRLRHHIRRVFQTCPKTERIIALNITNRWHYLLFPAIGILAVAWFLIRVVPKPSRAAYPCQQIAAGIGGTLLAYLIGILGSIKLFHFLRHRLKPSKPFVMGSLCASVLVGAFMMMLGTPQISLSGAFSPWTPSEKPNTPIGVAKGIHPGRVTWAHDPDATSWNGATDPNNAFWTDKNISMNILRNMFEQSLKQLTCESTVDQSWLALFRHFNKEYYHLNDRGYQSGEKILIKLNMVNDDGRQKNWGGQMRNYPSPQFVEVLIDHLVNHVGVASADITLADPSRNISDPIYKRIRNNSDAKLRNVVFKVNPNYAGNGRLAVQRNTSHLLRLSGVDMTMDLPECYIQARYIINLAQLKGHSMYGVTFCGKNHAGALYDEALKQYDAGWCPGRFHEWAQKSQPMNIYSPLVDVMGHEHLGRKAVLNVVDGLYGALTQVREIVKFKSLGNDWSSSIFLSQDPIAIDSVCLDFLRNEENLSEIVNGPGVDNEFHEAALAKNPPSGTRYDPEGDGSQLQSLGVHEHWNNATTRQYTRNLGTGNGIELIEVKL